jgi:hypothetical protein
VVTFKSQLQELKQRLLLLLLAVLVLAVLVVL